MFDNSVVSSLDAMFSTLTNFNSGSTESMFTIQRLIERPSITAHLHNCYVIVHRFEAKLRRKNYTKVVLAARLEMSQA